MRVVECEQLSLAWFEARRGIPTASNFSRVMPVERKCALRAGHDGPCRIAEEGERVQSKGRCQTMLLLPSAAADEYIAELIGERLSTLPLLDRPTNSAMRHGVECEPEARAFYALTREVEGRKVGLCLSDDGRFGCSPDWLVGDDGFDDADGGGLELKCPQAKAQVGYLLAGTLPDEYRPQVHGSLIVTGRAWWDFLSYSPGLPPLLLRVTPDDYTARLRAALEEFHGRLVETLAKIEAMR